jgi:cyclophilin family peptidyl-prolyl cis-trans isomerase/HEAT repeat protein
MVMFSPDRPREFTRRAGSCVLRVVSVAAAAALATFHVEAQTRPQAVTRLAIMQAEDRRAPTLPDVAVIRAGARSRDAQTAAIAVRALGRLERPSLVPDILPALAHALPEIRAEAANALAQALKGAVSENGAKVAVADHVIDALVARLNVESDAGVRGAICDALGRAPAAPAHVERVEAVLVEAAAREASIDGRLGIAAGFEALVRVHRRAAPPGAAALEALRSMVALSPPAARYPLDPSRTVRIRRLAAEALVAASALTDHTLEQAADDPDPQVRRLAMRAASAGNATAVLSAGLEDASSMVRLEALRAMRGRGPEVLCSAAVAAAADIDPHVALVALDHLAGCGASSEAVVLLERIVSNPPDLMQPRSWHRAAHAIVALAGSSPERSAAAVGRFATAPIWQWRMYAARAATVLEDAVLLEKLAGDDDDNVREAAVEGLAKIAGHAADAVYVRQLTRSGHQILRAAAAALGGTPNPDAAVPSLKAAHARLVAEGRDNSHDARAAIEKTLADLGVPVARRPDGSTPAAAAPRKSTRDAAGRRDSSATASPPGTARSSARTSRPIEGSGARVSDLDRDDLQRLAAARARITIRGVGSFDLVLFTSEAPATVLRFARLAEAGYYNGLTFHRVVPNFVIQGGSPGANEYIGDAMFMRDEVGQWPHVRGAVGISTRGRDTGDAQIFIDLVDNPRLNHQYTVFAQVLNGIDVVDQVLEGDVIEKIEIVPQ